MSEESVPASAYVVPDEVLEAFRDVRSVKRTAVPEKPRVRQYKYRGVQPEPVDVKDFPEDDLADLTLRELQVIRLMALGHEWAGVAREIGLSAFTVKSHSARIFKKTGTHNRVEVIVWAAVRGLLDAVPPTGEPGPKPYFSPREREMMRWVVTGLSNKDIGAKIFLTEDTVKTYMKRVFHKTGAKNRSHLVTIIWQRNLVPAIAFQVERKA